MEARHPVRDGPIRRRLRRLLQRGLFEPHVRISDGHAAALHRQVLERFAREPGANLLRIAPGLLAMLTIPLWVRLRSSYGVLVDAAAEVAFAALVVAFIWWMFRTAYRRHARRIIRERGFADICAVCGYDLSHAPQNVTTCPECGAEAGRFRSGSR